MTLMGSVFIFVGTSGSLTTLMGVRFLSSWKIMPAGLMAGARQGYFILAIGYLYIIDLFISGFFGSKDFPDVHNVHIQKKNKKCYLGIIDINMDRCIIFVVELCFMNYELYVLFYSLPLLQFVDVPEDWCESSTEFTKEEKITAFRNCTCRSWGDTEIVN